MDSNAQPMGSRSGVRFRLGTIALGHTVNKLWDWAFDYGLYPYVIYLCGLAWGFVIMAMLSFIICWLLVLFYDWSKRDWLGIEAVRDLKEYDGKSRYRRWMGWLLKRSDAMACILLSIKFDPFIVTVYMRRERFGGMTSADWRIFLLSWLIGNAYWSIVCFTGVSVVTWVWLWIKG